MSTPSTPAPAARPKSSRPKLTAEERRAVRELVEDSGYTRAEAIAWVTHFGVRS